MSEATQPGEPDPAGSDRVGTPGSDRAGTPAGAAAPGRPPWWSVAGSPGSPPRSRSPTPGYV
ncbi:hypothetical protein ACFQ51_35695 [Streptomyces kaempferi]